jgi:acyl phosphate:glycerol-3-phosphate acyltransferase
MIILGILFLIIGYLVGSLSSGILVCKAMKLPDPRVAGSGNPGATNVLRIGGKLPALLVLIGDALKGFIVVLVAKLIGINGFLLALVALATVVGHMYPAFFHFKGGKGVATAFGCVLVLSFWVALIGLIAWVIVVLISRYVSLASLVATILSAILILFVHTSYFLPVAVITVLIIWKHMENIERLKAGTENKIELK